MGPPPAGHSLHSHPLLACPREMHPGPHPSVAPRHLCVLYTGVTSGGVLHGTINDFDPGARPFAPDQYSEAGACTHLQSDGSTIAWRVPWQMYTIAEGAERH